MKILVTGGAGFIGSHLVRFLLDQNHDVVIIDRMHPYYSTQRKQDQLNMAKQGRVIPFYQQDLLDDEKTTAIFQQEQCDVVVHLAALPGVSYSIQQPLDYVDYDIKATINVLRAAGASGIKQVIFASSSSVYGEQTNMPLAESQATGKVVSPYAAAKWGAESFCHAYQHLFGFQLSILRFFTVYGPWGRPDMAITKFIKAIQAGEEIQVYGMDTARDYTYIQDIVKGIDQAIQTPFANEIFNLGAGNPVTMMQLLSIFKQYFPEMKVDVQPYRPGDVKVTHADISKAKSWLNYKPETSITTGIANTIEWALGYGK